MSILSNYVQTSCRGFLSRDRISRKNILNPQDFAERFVQAVQIAEVEPFRAVTHNKIMNGVDSCALQAMTFVPSKPGFTMLQKSVTQLISR
jgi:hydroxymethylglutaryl-CoA reductase